MQQPDNLPPIDSNQAIEASRLYEALFGRESTEIFSGNLKFGAVYGFDQMQNAAGPFFCINPISATMDYRTKVPKPGRADINCTSMRNFLFEFDQDLLTAQLEALQKHKHLFTTITYSGGKSLHGIIRLDEELPEKMHGNRAKGLYTAIHKGLTDYVERETGLKVDRSTSNPSRLSRAPNITRIEKEPGKPATSALQKLLYIGNQFPLSSALQLKAATRIPKSSMIADFDFDMSDEEFDRQVESLKDLSWIRGRLTNPEKWQAGAGLYHDLYGLFLGLREAFAPSRNSAQRFADRRMKPILRAFGYTDAQVDHALDCAYAVIPNYNTRSSNMKQVNS